uniref:Uncharacterized protein n=1 Tax=Mycobacterium avium TaxID=1764 RepID=Q8GE80_MYCAV|nr:unknown [Mycobacterium avium subsp. hominissuis A5]
MHKSCTIYASLVCPFLRYRHSRRPSDREVTRGDAEIVRFRHYGVAFFGPRTGPPYTDQTPWNHDDKWAYADHVETIRFETWRDLLPIYDQAVTADAKVVNLATRLYWTDSRRLDRIAQQDNTHLARLRATAPQVGDFRLALL